MYARHAPMKYIEDKFGLRWTCGMTDKYRMTHAKCSEEKLRAFLIKRGLAKTNSLWETYKKYSIQEVTNNCGEKNMTEKQKYRKVVPCGHLMIGEAETYFLLFPEPLPKRWENDALRYLVAPGSGHYHIEKKITTYPCARYVVVHGDHYIEYVPSSEPILVKNMGDDDLLNRITRVHND